MPHGVEVLYRFCVCQFIPNAPTTVSAPPMPGSVADTTSAAAVENNDKMVVRRWETNIKPRKIGCHGTYVGIYVYV